MARFPPGLDLSFWDMTHLRSDTTQRYDPYRDTMQIYNLLCDTIPTVILSRDTIPTVTYTGIQSPL